MIDIDHFKAVNDTYGHFAGDDVIASVAEVLKVQTRPGDLVCRFGGEEFVIFLKQADLDLGGVIAERLRKAIATSVVESCGVQIKVTVSIGGSLKDAAEEIDAAIKRADAALYEAKALGRNRTVMSPVPSGADKAA